MKDRNEYQREWYWKNRDKIRKKKNKANRKNEQDYFVRARRYHRKRIEVLKIYSNGEVKCVNCGEDRYECLQIDHINDDGNVERKKIPSGENFYYWLLKQEYQPDRYQILCANCNMIKRTRGILSYQCGLSTIKEWDEWSKSKYVKTPKEIKDKWTEKRNY